MKFPFYHLTRKLLIGRTIFQEIQKICSLIKKTNFNLEKTFLEIKSIDEILGEEFSVLSFNNILFKSFERKIQMKVLLKGESYCSYFITIGPINDFLPYDSLDITINNMGEDEGDMNPKRVPGKIEQIREAIFIEFLKV
ncbi:MAG: hypothetical protein NT161_00470 [Candidatus Nomurabacteria bacterium]|nr:hypothetical protein [Candidatus Nomurabacteria bacterium]